MNDARREVIRVRDLHAAFGDKQVLKGLNLTIRERDNYIIIGPSGCGKSVLLKHILGLFSPDRGSIRLWGTETVGLSEEKLAPLLERMSIVFQGGALLNSMTVGENVSLSLREVHHEDQRRIRKIVRERLEWVDMGGTEDLHISELSGGMKKRVAIARALATDPEVIFWDEPTTGLDPQLSHTIDELIFTLSRRLNNTSVTVTHDMTSAYYFGDRIGFLHDGRILLEGSPEEIRGTHQETLRRFMTRGDHHEEAASPAAFA